MVEAAIVFGFVAWLVVCIVLAWVSLWRRREFKP